MPEMIRKATFAWASIAGADAEPVEVIEQDGRRGVLTTGCQDPFWLDDDKAGVLLYVNTLKRPHPLETQEQRAARQKEYEAYRATRHGWRGPR
jgi:hypothetical protein